MTYLDSGLTYLDSGLNYLDSGLTYLDSGLKYLDTLNLFYILNFRLSELEKKGLKQWRSSSS